jgi:hypothetical protein
LIIAQIIWHQKRTTIKETNQIDNDNRTCIDRKMALLSLSLKALPVFALLCGVNASQVRGSGEYGSLSMEEIAIRGHHELMEMFNDDVVSRGSSKNIRAVRGGVPNRRLSKDGKGKKGDDGKGKKGGKEPDEKCALEVRFLQSKASDQNAISACVLQCKVLKF